MKMKPNKLLLLASLTALLGCDTAGLYEARISVGAVKAFDNGIAIHEEGLDRIVYLQVSRQGALVRELYRARSGEQLAWIAQGPGAEASGELFAMSVPLDRRDASRTEVLLRIPLNGGAIAQYRLNAPFDELVFDSQGHFAVLYHSGKSVPTEAGLYNPNEVAVVNLAEPPSTDNPRIRSVDMGGSRIEGASFVEPLSIAGALRQIVVFLGEGKVRLVDVEDPDLNGETVRLKTDEDLREVHPVQVLARQAEGMYDPCVLVRADGSQDVYGIFLFADAQTLSGFKFSQSLLEAGGDPRDMVTVNDGSTRLVLALSRSSVSSGNTVINVVDIDTANVYFSLPVEDPLTRAALIGPPEAQEAVFYGENGRGVHFLKAADLTDEGHSNLSFVPIPGRIQQVIPLDSERLLIVPRDQTGLVLLDLVDKSTIPLAADFEHSWTNAMIHGETVFFTIEFEQRQIVTLNLHTGHPESFEVDDAIHSLHILKGSNLGIILHDTPTGRATVFPTDNPTRQASIVVDGFWLEGMLDETEVPQ